MDHTVLPENYTIPVFNSYKHSPQMAPPLIVVGDIIVQLTITYAV